MKFNVFGRQVVLSRNEAAWTVWYLGPEGKRRPAPDLVVPASVTDSDMAVYLGDICHEWAREQHPGVRRLD